MDPRTISGFASSSRCCIRSNRKGRSPHSSTNIDHPNPPPPPSPGWAGGGVWPTVVTDTVTERSIIPPAPAQVSVNWLVAPRTGVCSLPAPGLLPVQAPVAVQTVASWLDQVSVERSPAPTVAGLAASVMVGAGAGVASTVTVTERLTAPAALLHERLNIVVAANADVICSPLVAFVPFQPPDAGFALAVQADAFAAFQESRVGAPEPTEAGLADNAKFGSAGAAATFLNPATTVQPGFCAEE